MKPIPMMMKLRIREPDYDTRPIATRAVKRCGIRELDYNAESENQTTMRNNRDHDEISMSSFLALDE